MILCISVLSVVISPFSSLISLIWLFTLFFLMSLANGLSIYLLKKTGFSFVHFCYGLLCFLIFKIPFLLLTLWVFISSFSSCFRCRVRLFDFSLVSWGSLYCCAAAAAAKSLQSCPTLCDPIDGRPPGSAVPRILQARTLEWVAISFCNAWKWKVKVESLSRVWLFTTPWTAAYQAPLSMGFSRQEYWSGLPLPSPVLLWTFPLALLLLKPIGFGLLCFHFHSFLCIFWFLISFHLWFVGYSEVCCLASICLYF